VPRIDQRIVFLMGENFLDKILFDDRGRINRIAMDATRAITPPSLFGIDRRIA
jgi:hypothetical protein